VARVWELTVANHKSAKKRARQTVKRTARNKTLRTRVKSVVKEFRVALDTGDKKEIAQACVDACRIVRKAASKGIVHKRTASRRVARIAAAAAHVE